MTVPILRNIGLAALVCTFTISCGSNSTDSTAQAPAQELSGFDYEAFIARTPVDHLNYDEENIFDSGDYDPASVQVQETLEVWDDIFAAEGISTRAEADPYAQLATRAKNCRRGTCAVWVFVSKSRQSLDLYIDGVLKDSWLVSTGTGNKTPDFDRHPNGRIYNAYTSNAYPGGDYKGLGNMPYAVFIQGGYALHGTPKSNWKYLGQKASHGCIRMHPDNGYRFNRLVREVGIKQTWISVD